MLKKEIITPLLVLVMCQLATAQITDFKAHSYSDSLGNELQYRLLKPADYDSSKSYPLVLFLHGAGERGSDNYSQLKWGVSHFADPTMRKKYPAFVLAPQVPKGEYWSSLKALRDTTTFTQPMLEHPSEPMRLTIELLEKLQKKYTVDKNRLYVTGISMGGFGTFDIIQRYPRKFAAAAPVCGGGDVSRAFILTDIPLWVFHGSKDKTVKPEYSRTMVDAIQLAGGSPGFTEYPDEGHVGAWVQAYRNPHLYEWMFSKELAPEE
ncbi:prolyl oligopeptidase family serine peptidase [Fodinibius halophilus]|uniref:Prolyl oligopeptidase family serine peptidase n=1 Tax=Fodinibius halophilus TaxID=1736908 RepID=A0A6M1T8G8_9BACT|nr:prolyl oligopeptidase family serine peptidase [Fodinibius halophilus]NGP88883.1 prolyl oligopeptidase family serine peptidase [Fodinibius halophilus]